MRPELEISKLLAMRQDIHTLKLDIEAEKKFLEQLQPKVQSAAEQCKKYEELLQVIKNRLRQHYLLKAHKDPSLRKNKRWLRAILMIQRDQKETQERYDRQAKLLEMYRRHEGILQGFKEEYSERVRLYIDQSDLCLQLNLLNAESPEDVFLERTFSLPRMSK